MAPQRTAEGRPRTGAGEAYVYGLSNKTFILGPTLEGSTSGAPDSYGASVGVSTGVVAVGAPGATVGTNSSQGQVYVYACKP
jgi:hypothetical protein